jgi:hypothetical protein
VGAIFFFLMEIEAGILPSSPFTASLQSVSFEIANLKMQKKEKIGK